VTDEIVTLDSDTITSVVGATRIEIVELARQGPPGPAGDAGLQGPPGAPGNTALTAISAVALSGHRALALNGDGFAVYASSDAWTAQAIVGISQHAGEAGAEITVQDSGAMGWPANDLIPQAPVFLGLNGLLTQIVPVSGWLRCLGFAVDTDLLMIDIGPTFSLGV
jgi:hypothetical protein